MECSRKRLNYRHVNGMFLNLLRFFLSVFSPYNYLPNDILLENQVLSICHSLWYVFQQKKFFISVLLKDFNVHCVFKVFLQVFLYIYLYKIYTGFIFVYDICVILSTLYIAENRIIMVLNKNINQAILF